VARTNGHTQFSTVLPSCARGHIRQRLHAMTATLIGGTVVDVSPYLLVSEERNASCDVGEAQAPLLQGLVLFKVVQRPAMDDT
jgi:hypothetical protein